jgi:putative molybdopterin biosynthesis protein
LAGLLNRLREWRRRAGLTQQELAERAGVTRQTISGIESGLYGPGVEVGLRLARVLGCHVEDLFELERDGAETLAVGVDLAPRAGSVRVALAEIAGRTVARPLSGLGAFRWPTAAAHGLARAAARGTTVQVRRLPGGGRGLFLAGCDPALGLLAAHAGRGPGHVEALWWQAGNADAVVQLGRREVHAAAVHRPTGGMEPPPPFALARFRIASWEMGWIVRPGNPKGIRGAGDLRRPDVRLANREPGSGARSLLDRLLAEADVPVGRVRGYDREFGGHVEVAEAVALGVADVAVGLGAAAEDHGLDFLPVTSEVCDLWLPQDGLGDPAVAALLDALNAGSFRTDLAAFGPYDTTETGDRVA